MKAEEGLTGKVIGAAMRVHSALGPGFLESVYEKSLSIELLRLNLSFESQKPVPVHYLGESVGDFIADILVENVLILEIKAVRSLTSRHEAQLVNYLTATAIETGLLLNFGADRLEFKKKFRTYLSTQEPPIL